MKEKLFLTLNCLLVAFLILWPLAWLITGAYYSHPNAEDLSLSLLPRDHGILESIANMLVTYDGRYFTNLLHAINPLVLNSITGFKWMPVAGISLLVLSFWFFLVTFFKGVSKLQLLVFSLFFTVLHFAMSPSLPHDLYWLVSSYVYLYPWSFTFLWIAAYVRFIHSVKSGHSLIWFLATIVFLVCCIGMNEMFLVTNSLLLLFITYRSYKQNKDAFNKTMPVAIAGIACILFFVSCPGILFRMEANIPTDKSLLNMPGVLQSLSDYPYTLGRLLHNGLLLAASFLVLLFVKDVQFRYPDFTGLNSSRIVLMAIAICMTAAYLMSLAYYLPMQVDSGYPARIFNSVIILQELVILVLLPLLLYHHGTIRKIASSILIQRIAPSFILIIMIVQLVFSENNISTMRTEYNQGRFESLDKTMNNRYAKIEAAKAGTDCLHIAVVDSLVNPPATIYHGPDISRNRKVNYWNMAYESYFGIDEIKIEGDSLLF